MGLPIHQQDDLTNKLGPLPLICAKIHSQIQTETHTDPHTTDMGEDESNYQFKCSMQWLILNLEVIQPKKSLLSSLYSRENNGIMN